MIPEKPAPDVFRGGPIFEKIMRNKGAFYSMPKGSSLRIATAVQPFDAAPLAAGR